MKQIRRLWVILALVIPASVSAQPINPTVIKTEESDSTVDAFVTSLDFGSCFDLTSSPTSETNISFDSAECTINADALKANGTNCSAGQYPLGVDASGNAEGCTAAGGSGSPGGSNTEIQYNNAGAFGGISTFTTSGTNVTLNGGDLNVQDSDDIDFGDSSDITAQYNPSTEDFELDNTLNDIDVAIDIDDMPISHADTYATDSSTNFAFFGDYDATCSTCQVFGNGVDVTATAGTGQYLYGYTSTAVADGSGTNPASVIGNFFIARSSTNASVTELYGQSGWLNTMGGGDFATGAAFDANLILENGTTFTNLSGLQLTYSPSGTITGTELRYLNLSGGAATGITNQTGLYIGPLSGATNNRAIYIEGSGADNAIYFDAGESRIYDDNTDLVIDPAASGSGRVIIGPTSNGDMELNELGLCGTDITGSTAVVLGSCSGSKRGTLNFSFNKNAGTGIAANIASSLTYDISGTNANATGINSAMTSVVGGSGTNTITALGTSITNSTNYTTGTYQFRGLNIGTVTSPASSAGATIYQIGMQQREMSAFASATAETRIGGIFENDLLVTTGDRLYLEGTGGSTPALGDTYLHYDSAETAMELFVNGTEGLSVDTTYFQTPLTTVVGTLAGNYVALLPAGDITFGPAGQLLTQGNRFAFVYTADGVTPSSAGLKFDLTNVAYAFTDIFGASSLSASVATNDWLVHNSGRGLDTFTAGHGLAIGRASAGAHTYGNATNTTSHTFTTDGTGNGEIVLPNDSISNEEIDEADAFTWTSTHDFGGATSLEIPNGTAPTVDAAGEIAEDTTSPQLIFGANANVLDPEMQMAAYSLTGTSGIDNLGLTAFNYDVTITAVSCRCITTCTTAATIRLEDGSGNAMTQSADATCQGTSGSSATVQSVTAANTLTAGELLAFDITNAHTANQRIMVTLSYTVTRQ